MRSMTEASPVDVSNEASPSVCCNCGARTPSAASRRLPH